MPGQSGLPPVPTMLHTRPVSAPMSIRSPPKPVPNVVIIVEFGPSPLIRVSAGSIHVDEILIVPAGSKTVFGKVDERLARGNHGFTSLEAQVSAVPCTPRASITRPCELLSKSVRAYKIRWQISQEAPHRLSFA